MAHQPDDVQTSAKIAAHAGTNAVVVRRVLGRLREAGLLTSEKGHSGGWRLARAPQNITLADVYLALEEKLVAPPSETFGPACSVESALLQHVSEVMADVENNLIKRLGTTTIAEVSVPRS